MADLKHAKEEMRKWLRDNKNSIFGIIKLHIFYD